MVFRLGWGAALPPPEGLRQSHWLYTSVLSAGIPPKFSKRLPLLRDTLIMHAHAGWEDLWQRLAKGGRCTRRGSSRRRNGGLSSFSLRLRWLPAKLAKSCRAVTLAPIRWPISRQCRFSVWHSHRLVEIFCTSQ